MSRGQLHNASIWHSVSIYAKAQLELLIHDLNKVTFETDFLSSATQGLKAHQRLEALCQDTPLKGLRYSSKSLNHAARHAVLTGIRHTLLEGLHQLYQDKT